MEDFGYPPRFPVEQEEPQKNEQTSQTTEENIENRGKGKKVIDSI